MTPEEAIEILKDFEKQVAAKAGGAYQSTIGNMACKFAIEAIKEVQQYREIGTVEECRDARNMQTPEAPEYETEISYMILGSARIAESITKLIMMIMNIVRNAERLFYRRKWNV